MKGPVFSVVESNFTVLDRLVHLTWASPKASANNGSRPVGKAAPACREMTKVSVPADMGPELVEAHPPSATSAIKISFFIHIPFG